MVSDSVLKGFTVYHLINGFLHGIHVYGQIVGKHICRGSNALLISPDEQ